MPGSKRGRGARSAGPAGGSSSSLEVFVDHEFENVEPNVEIQAQEKPHPNSAARGPSSLRQRLDGAPEKFSDKPLLMCQHTPQAAPQPTTHPSAPGAEVRGYVLHPKP